jgi:hypothetical protein
MYSSTHSLASALDGCDWSVSRPGRFTPRERVPSTYWIGTWVGPRAVLDVMVKRKIPSPLRESKPRTPIVQPVAQHYTDLAITALISVIYDLKINLINNETMRGLMFSRRRRFKSRSFGLWRWRQLSPPKRRYPTATLHDVTTQKTSTWIQTMPH